MNSLSEIYLRMDMENLKRIKGEKLALLHVLESVSGGYFNQRDRERLERQLVAIDAAIACKRDQLNLF